jgi:hypothetical protein
MLYKGARHLGYLMRLESETETIYSRYACKIGTPYVESISGQIRRSGEFIIRQSC